jgi:hypothetical protein
MLSGMCIPNWLDCFGASGNRLLLEFVPLPLWLHLCSHHAVLSHSLLAGAGMLTAAGAGVLPTVPPALLARRQRGAHASLPAALGFTL